MRRAMLVFLLCVAGVILKAREKDSLLVMFWNVENFFDWIDQGTGVSDREYSSYGERHWTKSKFYTKCDAISKSIMWISDKYGRMPDIIGLAEVENKGVLTKMLSYTLLRKYDYGIIHQDSRDSRGIDVALLYRKSIVTPLSVNFISPSTMKTRDILHVHTVVSGVDTIDFIVNHHPSKYGGETESAGRRNEVMGILGDLCDSLIVSGRKVVAMGDFNDTPDAAQFKILDEIMINKGWPLHERGEGTIRYEGKWDLIDMFITSDGLCSSEMEVVKIPFLMTYEKKYPGEKPLRTYSGPRYIGGVSDHCPIILTL